MRMHRIAGALLTLLVCSTPAAGWAQQGPSGGARERFWVGIGIGGGVGRLDCSRCGSLAPDDPWRGGSGASGFVAAGRALRPGLSIGGELSMWARRSEEQKRDATLFLLSLMARHHPGPSGLYLKGGAGAGASILAGGNGLIEGGGLGVQAGAGYDLRLRPGLSLGPYLSYLRIFGAGATGQNQGVPVTGPSDPSAVQFGLGLTWR